MAPPGQQQYDVINLITATVKVDAEERGLRCCFRIISPGKTLTLQVRRYTSTLPFWYNNSLLQQYTATIPHYYSYPLLCHCTATRLHCYN